MQKENSEILVSVIVPSYKRTIDFVERAISSLLEQTYSNIEIVLVDDNAKDELLSFRQTLEKYVADLNEPRLVYVQNKQNLGGAGARNEGISIAKGEYVTFLDDDDVYLPEKIERQILFMLDNDLDVCFTNLNLYDEFDKLIDVRIHYIESFDLQYLRRYHLTKQITGTPTFMMRKKVLEEIGGFEIVPMGQEFYLMHKILQGDYKIGHSPECFIKAYRTKAEAISTGKNKITGEKALYAYKKKQFGILSFKEKQYVRCRHYAVMAIAYKRNRMYFRMFGALIVAVLCSPYTAFKEALNMNKRVKKGREA